MGRECGVWNGHCLRKSIFNFSLFPSGFNTRKLLLSVHEMRKLSHFSTENESLFVFMYRNEVVASFLVPRSLLRWGEYNAFSLRDSKRICRICCGTRTMGNSHSFSC